MQISALDWKGIEALRSRIEGKVCSHVAEAAQHFVSEFCEQFSTVVLARLFLVVPFDQLLPSDQDFARSMVNGDGRLNAGTRVLSLLGSCGQQANFVGRSKSNGHLAIPLLDRQFVQQIPMITRLLADLEVDFQALDDGRPIATRRLLGGQNNTFYVDDAATARDESGRAIIPAGDFVRDHNISTVFGMGGSYADGTLAAAILFTREKLERPVVDRFASFISTFKMTTAMLQQQGALYVPAHDG